MEYIAVRWVVYTFALLFCVLPLGTFAHLYYGGSQYDVKLDKYHRHMPRKVHGQEEELIPDHRTSHRENRQQQGTMSSSESERSSDTIASPQKSAKHSAGRVLEPDPGRPYETTERQYRNHRAHHQKYRRQSEKQKSNAKKQHDSPLERREHGRDADDLVARGAYGPARASEQWFEPERGGSTGYVDQDGGSYRTRRYDQPVFFFRSAFPQPRIGMAFHEKDTGDKYSSYYYMADDAGGSRDEDDANGLAEDDHASQKDVALNKEGTKYRDSDELEGVQGNGNEEPMESDNKNKHRLESVSNAEREEKVPGVVQKNDGETIPQTEEREDGFFSGDRVNDTSGVNFTSESRLSYRSPMYVDFRSPLARPSTEPDVVKPVDESVEKPEIKAEPERDGSASAKDELNAGRVSESITEEDKLVERDTEDEIVHNESSVQEVTNVPEPETEELLEPVVERDIESDTESENDAKPKPESETEPEAEPESEFKPVSEPSQEVEALPPIDDEDTEEFDVIYDEPVYAEPEPDWDTAKRIWGPAWEVHVYGVGIAFAVLAGYSCFSLLRLWKHRNLLSQGYFVSLNIIMLFMGFFRSMYFLIDGYNSNNTFHPVGAYFLLSIGFPCITSAFSILFLALLQSTKMQIASPRIQSTRFLMLVVSCHFGLSILTDIVVGYLYNAEAMLFVCQAATVLWGLALFGGYIYVFRKLYLAAMWRQKEMMRQMLARVKLDGISPITKTPKLTLNIAIKVTLLTAMLGLIMAALMIYGMAGVYSIFSHSIPDPWPWWGFKFALRLVELGMCATMSYVATQPFRYNQITSEKKWNWSGFFYLAPCRRLCACDEQEVEDDDLDWEELPGDSLSNHVDNRNVNHVNQVLCNPEESVPMTQQDGYRTAREDSPNSKKNTASRPASLLVNDNGFVRFRQNGEVGGDVLISTDDELDTVESSPRANPFVTELEKNGLINTNVNDFYYADKLPDKFYDPLNGPNAPNCFMRSVPLARRLASRNVPVDTGNNTPGTPRSFYSAHSELDRLDASSSVWSFRPPSSIHLRDSIENALDLDLPGFNLRTPDCLDSPNPSNRMFLYKLRDRFSRHKSLSSMSDLQSLRDYKNRRFLDSHNSFDISSTGYCTPEEMDPELESSESTLKSTRSQLFRSYSDSIGSIFHDPYTYMLERRRAQRETGYESSMQMQDLLRDINAMCSAIGDMATDKSADITPV